MSHNEHISDKEIKQKAPLLFNLKKEELHAPEAYFEGLSNEVISKTKAPIRKMPVRKNLNIVWRAAAGIAILLGSYFLLKPSADDSSIDYAVESIQMDLDEDLDYLMEIEDEIIYDVLAEQVPLEEDEILDPRIEYLLDEDIELDEIINL